MVVDRGGRAAVRAAAALLLLLALLLGLMGGRASAGRTSSARPAGQSISLSDVTVLLPHAIPGSKYGIVSYDLKAEGGCFQWRLDLQSVISLTPLQYSRCTSASGAVGYSAVRLAPVPYQPAVGGGRCDPASHPDTCGAQAAALAAAEDAVPGRQSVWVMAAELDTDERVECEVFVDQVHRLEILTTTRRISIGDTEVLQLLGFDDKENSFSSLEGLWFQWSNTAEHVLGRLTFDQAMMNSTEVRRKMERDGASSDLFPVKGLLPGAARLTAKLLYSPSRTIEASVQILVTEPLFLEPVCLRLPPAAHQQIVLLTRSPHPAYGASVDAFNNTVARGGAAADSASAVTAGAGNAWMPMASNRRRIAMPSAQYRWSSGEESVVYVDPFVGTLTTKLFQPQAYAGSLGGAKEIQVIVPGQPSPVPRMSQVTVSDTVLPEHNRAANIWVSQPTRISVNLVPLTELPMEQQWQRLRRSRSSRLCPVNPPAEFRVRCFADKRWLMVRGFDYALEVLVYDAEGLLLDVPTNARIHVSLTQLQAPADPAAEASGPQPLVQEIEMAGFAGNWPELLAAPKPVADLRVLETPLGGDEDGMGLGYQFESGAPFLKFRVNASSPVPAQDSAAPGSVFRIDVEWREMLAPATGQVLRFDAPLRTSRIVGLVAPSRIAPDELVLPFTGLAAAQPLPTAAQYQLEVVGGSGSFRWASEDPDVLEVGATTGLAWASGRAAQGTSRVAATDACAPENVAWMPARVSRPAQPFFLPGRLEMETVTGQLQVALGLTDTEGRRFTNCSAIGSHTSVEEGQGSVVVTTPRGVEDGRCFHECPWQAGVGCWVVNLQATDRPGFARLRSHLTGLRLGGGLTGLDDASSGSTASHSGQQQQPQPQYVSQVVSVFPPLELCPRQMFLAVGATAPACRLEWSGPLPWPGRGFLQQQPGSRPGYPSGQLSAAAIAGGQADLRKLEGGLDAVFRLGNTSGNQLGSSVLIHRSVELLALTAGRSDSGPWRMIEDYPADSDPYDTSDRSPDSSLAGDVVSNDILSVWVAPNARFPTAIAQGASQQLRGPRRAMNVSCVGVTPSGEPPLLVDVRVGNQPSPGHPQPVVARSFIQVTCLPAIALADRAMVLGVGTHQPSRVLAYASLAALGSGRPSLPEHSPETKEVLARLHFWVEDPCVASVDEFGVVTGLALGETVLRVEIRGTQASEGAADVRTVGLSDWARVTVQLKDFRIHSAQPILIEGQETTVHLSGVPTGLPSREHRGDQAEAEAEADDASGVELMDPNFDYVQGVWWSSAAPGLISVLPDLAAPGQRSPRALQQPLRLNPWLAALRPTVSGAAADGSFDAYYLGAASGMAASASAPGPGTQQQQQQGRWLLSGLFSRGQQSASSGASGNIAGGAGVLSAAALGASQHSLDLLSGFAEPTLQAALLTTQASSAAAFSGAVSFFGVDSQESRVLAAGDPGMLRVWGYTATLRALSPGRVTVAAEISVRTPGRHARALCAQAAHSRSVSGAAAGFGNGCGWFQGNGSSALGLEDRAQDAERKHVLSHSSVALSVEVLERLRLLVPDRVLLPPGGRLRLLSSLDHQKQFRVTYGLHAGDCGLFFQGSAQAAALREDCLAVLGSLHQHTGAPLVDASGTVVIPGPSQLARIAGSPENPPAFSFVVEVRAAPVIPASRLAELYPGRDHQEVLRELTQTAFVAVEVRPVHSFKLVSADGGNPSGAVAFLCPSAGSRGVSATGPASAGVVSITGLPASSSAGAGASAGASSGAAASLPSGGSTAAASPSYASSQAVAQGSAARLHLLLQDRSGRIFTSAQGWTLPGTNASLADPAALGQLVLRNTNEAALAVLMTPGPASPSTAAAGSPGSPGEAAAAGHSALAGSASANIFNNNYYPRDGVNHLKETYQQSSELRESMEQAHNDRLAYPATAVLAEVSLTARRRQVVPSADDSDSAAAPAPLDSERLPVVRLKVWLDDQGRSGVLPAFTAFHVGQEPADCQAPAPVAVRLTFQPQSGLGDLAQLPPHSASRRRWLAGLTQELSEALAVPASRIEVLAVNFAELQVWLLLLPYHQAPLPLPYAVPESLLSSTGPANLPDAQWFLAYRPEFGADEASQAQFARLAVSPARLGRQILQQAGARGSPLRSGRITAWLTDPNNATGSLPPTPAMSAGQRQGRSGRRGGAGGSAAGSSARSAQAAAAAQLLQRPPVTLWSLQLTPEALANANNPGAAGSGKAGRRSDSSVVSGAAGAPGGNQGGSAAEHEGLRVADAEIRQNVALAWRRAVQRRLSLLQEWLHDAPRGAAAAALALGDQLWRELLEQREPEASLSAWTDELQAALGNPATGANSGERPTQGPSASSVGIIYDTAAEQRDQQAAAAAAGSGWLSPSKTLELSGWQWLLLLAAVTAGVWYVYGWLAGGAGSVAGSPAGVPVGSPLGPQRRGHQLASPGVGSRREPGIHSQFNQQSSFYSRPQPVGSRLDGSRINASVTYAN